MASQDAGYIIRKFRNQARLTQTALAQISTVSVRTIRDLENGRVDSPRQETVRLIANSLHLAESQRLVLHAACGATAEDAAVRLICDAAPIAPPARVIGLSGRDHETHAVVEALTYDRNRWITVTGLHGVGKSELALDVAHTLYQLHGFSVLWVPCDDSREQMEAPSRLGVDSAIVARVSRINEQILDDTFDIHQLCHTIGQRRTLLVLDGCDLSQVRSERVLALLSGCRELRLLITTRNSGSTPGEHLVPLEPLALPRAEECLQASEEENAPALRLLLSYIRRLRPEFAHPPVSVIQDLTRVCRALDCLPGALKQGAQWALVLSPEELLDRATHDPLSLVAPATGGTPEKDFRSSLEETLSSLSRHERQVVRQFARRRAVWHVHDVAMATGLSELDSAHTLGTLVLKGLVRRLPSSSSSSFRVLNLVSHLVMDPIPTNHHLNATGLAGAPVLSPAASSAAG